MKIGKKSLAKLFTFAMLFMLLLSFSVALADDSVADIPAIIPGSMNTINTDNYENHSHAASQVEFFGTFAEADTELTAEYSVRLRETGELFQTLNQAIAAARDDGLSSFTLEIIGDVTETSSVIISSEDITIIGLEGKHIITLPAQSGTRFSVEGGGSLTLGDGTDANTLTILHSVNVTNGSIHVKDGIKIVSGTALNLNGSNVSGTISGGYFEGTAAHALDMRNGAKLSEISGGMLLGKNNSIHMSGAGTKIELISGGKFYQTDSDTALHGHAVFVQNNAQIGEISGGHFEAVRNCALVIVRDGWVDEISGGEFIANRVGPFTNRNAAIWIESEGGSGKTGIGTISGGHINGTNFGLLSISWSNRGAQIDQITGGLFEGTVALQNDRGGFIGEISGGKFEGGQGILNAGKIGEIGGQVEMRGSSYGLYNFQNALIEEISGGLIVSTGSHGVANDGTIDLISGGTIIGWHTAIRCFTNGKIDTITGGVFQGRLMEAITLTSEVKLEPGLDTTIGFGRYQGNNGVIFNNESLVKYPGTAPDIYFMSTQTIPVAGIQGVQFKFLTLSATAEVTFDCNGGSFEDASMTDMRIVNTGGSVGTDMPFAPIQAGYTFLSWNTKADGTGDEFTGDTIVIDNMTVYAQWEKNESGGGSDVGNGSSGGGGSGSGNATVVNPPAPPQPPESPEQPGQPGQPESPGSNPESPEPQEPESPIIVILLFMVAVAAFSYRRKADEEK